MALRKSRFLLFCIFFSFLIAGCGPSYPAGEITESVKEIVKKEYDLESEAKLVGNTLYLEIKLDNLATTETKKLIEMLKHLQGAVLSIVRVSLSSDADIDFMVVSASDPAWKIGVRIIEYLQDVKDYLYMKISRGDYEGRLIMEIDTAGEGMVVYENNTPLTMNEFLGRLIVSQFNMLSRTNPFLGIFLEKYQMKYVELTDSELILSASEDFDPEMFALAEKLLIEETKKVIKKYNISNLEKITIIGQDIQPVTVDINKPLKQN
ncbi:hypothetical protein ACFL58_03700 [Elusimicrobiota bacterium]